MGFRESFVRQFGRPEGALGHVAGWIMANRPSNRQRNLWTVELLGIKPGNRILEFGCGPGLALKACVEKVGNGLVVGFDHSQLMLDQAARLNREAVAQGTLELHLGALDRLHTIGGAFDKVYSVNVIQFIQDKVAAFHAIYDLMAPGGTIASTYQPRHRNPTRGDAFRVADEVMRTMAKCGFEAVRVEELPLRPVPAVCALGRK
jgi:ubiquinone/menaquinone biosynthesis C-methylase UbiE